MNPWGTSFPMGYVMPREIVYLETSVISYLAARPSRDLLVAAQQKITSDWWEKERHRYDLAISEFVLAEAAAGNPEVAKRRMALLEGLNLFDLKKDVFQLTSSLIDQKAVPDKAKVDAFHIAVATVNGADYLLTWNCKHINNAHTRKLITQVCIANGFDPPVLCTPQEIMEEW